MVVGRRSLAVNWRLSVAWLALTAASCGTAPAPGAVYPHDRFVYWQFSSSALANLAALTDGSRFSLHATPIVDGHPRIIGTMGS